MHFNKALPIISLIGLMTCSSALIADQSVEELRAELKELRANNPKKFAQNSPAQRRLQDTLAKIAIIEKQDTFTAAIDSLTIKQPTEPRSILIYTRTRGFRHQSIPFGTYALIEIGKRTGAYTAVATEDPAVFSSPEFMNYDGVIMLNTTGDDTIPTGEARANFEQFLAAGKGLIGIHAATDCHSNWSNYLEAMGGIFDGHPWRANEIVTLYNEEPEHPICSHIKTGETIRDEIYQYKDDEHFTREKLRILLSLDLNGKDMKRAKMKRADNDYAVSWIREYANSRVFYSNLGHNDTTFMNPMALQHFLNGIQYALGDLQADARPSSQVGNGTAQALPEGF